MMTTPTRHSPSQWTVSGVQDISYSIEFATDILNPSNGSLLESLHDVRRLVVTDTTVEMLYGDKIHAYFQENCSEYQLLVLPHGETAKAWKSVEAVIEKMESFKLDRRREPVIAIGGGVLTDIVGFACSIYRRNTPFVRVPTTLIGAVDAGVGVKTGVNFRNGKNKIGTYFAASRTIIDPGFLATVDSRHISNGLAEILKIALIKDEQLFDLLAEHGQEVLSAHCQDSMTGGPSREILVRAIEGMLEELEPNLWEKTLERVVDYGHTFSPTIEMAALPDLLHGEAVCIDMALTTVMSRRRGLLSQEEQAEVLRVMTSMGLPTFHPEMTAKNLSIALADTTRHRDGLQRLPLPVGIGEGVFVNDVTETEIAEAVAELRELAATKAAR